MSSYTELRPEHARRRPLPDGYRNEYSPWYVIGPIRSYYQTVSVIVPAALDYPLPRHEIILDAALDWCESDLRKRGRHVPD